MNESRFDSTDDRISALVAQALAAIDRGEDVDVRALCAAHPDLVPAVREGIAIGRELPVLHAASAALDMRADTLLGGRYRLRTPLGRGAAGTVYAARDEELDREVAVKILQDGLLGDARAEERFLREALILARHEHPNILRIYDRGRIDGGGLFLVTELLRGASLQAILDRCVERMPGGPTPPGFADAGWLREALPAARLERTLLLQAVAWVTDIGAGLAAAHAEGVLHRDVKPSNAFVREDGTAVLLDFGLATRPDDPSVTLPHDVVGTPWYMPPEQARGGAEPAPTIDVYGLTATLYHLVTLQPPQPGDLATVLAAARERDPVPAARLHRGLPRDLGAILDRGLEADPRARYRTVDELVADLRAFLDHRPVKARPVGGLGRAVRRLRRRPVASLAAVATGSTVVLGAAVWLLASTVFAERRQDERDDLWARLPAQMTVEGKPGERLLIESDEREAWLPDLDRLIELEPDDLATRFLRASARLDVGNVEGAAADIAEVAARSDSPYLRTVARRYAAADGRMPSIEAIDLDGLPPPASREDFFVAGFHALRRHDDGPAVELLAQAIDYLPARDIRLIALLGVGRFEEAIAEAYELEGLYRRRTARTRHALSVGYYKRGLYREAIEMAEESLELRPGRHGPWQNLAAAYLRLGDLQEAERCLREAHALRPWFENTKTAYAQLLRDLGKYDEARAKAREIEATWQREWELANVDLIAALEARRQGDTARQRELARSARLHFERSQADTSPANEKRGSAPWSISVAEALAAGDATAAMHDLLNGLHPKTYRPAQLLNLAALLEGRTLSGWEIDMLRKFLLRIAVNRWPDDARIRTAYDALK